MSVFTDRRHLASGRCLRYAEDEDTDCGIEQTKQAWESSNRVQMPDFPLVNLENGLACWSLCCFIYKMGRMQTL